MNSEKRSRVVCRLGLALAFCASLGVTSPRYLFAQSTTEGAIGGTVTDQTKAVVPGATVTAKNLGTTTRRPRPPPMRAATSRSSG